MKVTAPLQRGGVERDRDGTAANAIANAQTHVNANPSANANANAAAVIGTIRSDPPAPGTPAPHQRVPESPALSPRALTIAAESAHASPISGWGRFAKRGFDLTGAVVGLAALSPLLIASGLAVAMTSGWPIFYLQDRVGQRGHIFRMWKFRSMRKDAEQLTGPIWASDKDARCTRIGRILRKTNIDELPQLWNVILGDMSLVGPRPERPVFVEQFRDTVPNYEDRHAAPVGMTGWAQVHGWRGRTSIRKRVEFDLDYLRNWSFGLDLRILAMTVQHVLFGKTNWKSSSADEADREAAPCSTTG